MFVVGWAGDRSCLVAWRVPITPWPRAMCHTRPDRDGRRVVSSLLLHSGPFPMKCHGLDGRVVAEEKLIEFGTRQAKGAADLLHEVRFKCRIAVGAGWDPRRDRHPNHAESSQNPCVEGDAVPQKTKACRQEIAGPFVLDEVQAVGHEPDAFPLSVSSVDRRKMCDESFGPASKLSEHEQVSPERRRFRAASPIFPRVASADFAKDAGNGLLNHCLLFEAAESVVGDLPSDVVTLHEGVCRSRSAHRDDLPEHAVPHGVGRQPLPVLRSGYRGWSGEGCLDLTKAPEVQRRQRDGLR